MCCSLCLCMACAVLSSVSLVYLTFIVYIPAKREISSGLLEVPVICTTTDMRETDQCEYRGRDSEFCYGELNKRPESGVPFQDRTGKPLTPLSPWNSPDFCQGELDEPFSY